ncbi:MAG TPA: F0F1 ATP synthase subunit beta, partial [Acidimicrobiia bacterium]|nr:F0F1 ATP synthase subunit beta [Acidimicrobiia bacterium]
MTVTESGTGTELKEGRIVGIAGPVIDVEFPRGHLPEINTALELDLVMDGETETITAETAQQIGEGRVRAICLRPTDGLTRGAPVR